MKTAFTLVELMIVISILGILAAIVLPEFTTQTQQAKEAVAKDNLRILRNVIERYAIQHNGVPPGYLNGSVGGGILTFIAQTTKTTDIAGTSSGTTTVSELFPFGPYLTKVPENPLNNKGSMHTLGDEQPFPDVATDTYGWIYKPQTKQIRLDSPGLDSQGVKYFDY